LARLEQALMAAEFQRRAAPFRVVRVPLVCLLAAGIVATPAAASPMLEPPVIHEVFTPLPCPANPQTTLALEGCAERVILSRDRAINSQLKVIFGLLRSHAARRSFVAGEQSWLRYRGASCTAQVSNYAGGSAQPVVYGYCIAARNKTHLADPADVRKTLSQH
jgi:uncharacterized protein YecT (DUF1311 family)